MNKDNTLKVLESVSTVAKTYTRISYMKTALTAIFVGYVAIKTVMFFKDK